MNSNHRSNWQKPPQEKAELRQPQPVDSESERWQPEVSQSLLHSYQVDTGISLSRGREDLGEAFSSTSSTHPELHASLKHPNTRLDELEWLRTLHDSLPCIYFTLNSTGIILSISQFGATYLGYGVAELTQQLIAQVFYWNDQASCQAQLTELQQPTETRQWEARLVNKNSSILWVKAIARLVPGTELNPVISLVCEDITAHKQAENALRQSKERFRSLVETTSDWVWEVNENAVYTYVSPRISDILGYTPEEILGKTPFDLMPPEEARRVAEIFSPIAASRRPLTCLENRNLHKDGHLVILETSGLPFFDSEGSFRGYRGIDRDISDAYRQAMLRKQVEEELLQKSQALANFSSNLKQLHRLNTAKYNSFEHLLSEYLQTACEILQLPTGIVGQVEGQSYIIRSVQSDFNFLVPGLEFELKDTYCAAVVEKQKTITYCRVGEIGSMRGHPVYQNLGLESYICTPIFVNNQIYGTLNFSSTQPKITDFETDEQEIIELMAQSIGSFIAAHQAEIERNQAEEALRQQFLREQLVGATLGRIHQSLNLEEILNTTVAEVRQFLACDRVIIFRINSDGSGIVVVESVAPGWIPMSGTVIYDRHFAKLYIKLYQQGRVQAVEDIYTAGLTQCHVDLLAQFQARANLVVPIVQEDQLWGLLVAQQCQEPRKWQPLEIDLLRSLSTQAGIAIHQSELYQQAQTEITQRQQAEAALQQQFLRERLIGAIAQRIRKSLHLEKILNATVAEVRQVLHTDRVIIFRFEPDWSGNVVVESVDSNYLAILGTNIYDPCFKEVCVLPYQQGRVKAIEDIHTANLSECYINLLTQFQVRANLVVPILKGEHLWGLLIAHHCSGTREWQQFEIDLLSSLAFQVAIAIQQSQLYEQAQSQAKREQALNQVTQVIRSSLDLNTIFSTAVCEIGKLLQVDRAQIVQYLPERKCWLHVSEYRKSPDSPVTLGVEIPDENNEITERLKRLEIVKIHDAQICEDEINKSLAQAFPGAWLQVPLHFNSNVWGCITLERDIHPYHWQESEVDLICAVADQVAIAIHQAELYEQSRSATATALTQAQQLEQTLVELQRTQSQLVQSEKMSSLGQLVAGVAHEINNPVNFIYGNLSHASRYTEDLLGLIKLYQQYSNPMPEIQSEIEAIDLAFLIEDLPKLLDSMKVGAERICEIVRSLRNFSRLAEAEMKAVDIHEGLDSTLMILQSRLRAHGEHPGIQVIKEYGNLPNVECYAGELNQVFMNLLSNALDALDEQNQAREALATPDEFQLACSANQNPLALRQQDEVQDKEAPEQIPANLSTIRVCTELLNNHQIVIRIADNGPGMTKQVKARLFDPFFTTKPVGSGTGLGLSISYQIVVEKHGGQLHCFSELGQGTEFVIQLPLKSLVVS